MTAEATEPRRASRLRLYLPLALLALVAAGWSVAWFAVRGQVIDGLDRWLSAEAAAGRRWTCLDRQVAGFPFRIELGCGAVTLERPDLVAKAGRLGVVAQVYRPSHVVAELQGPLTVRAGDATVTAGWTLLRASVVASAEAIERVAAVADAPTIRADAPDVALDLSAARLELHGRPDPAVPDAVDGALTATAARVPGLDALIGGGEPADLDLILAVTRARDLPARPLLAELERWRSAGGRLDVSRLGVAKGPRRIEAKGQLFLDDAHRPSGQVELASANVEGVLGSLVGGRAIDLLGALMGGAKPAAPAAKPGEPALKPFPPLRLENGRVLLGPFQVPGLRLPPLY